MKIFWMFFLCSGLSACAAVWGAPHKVVFESESSITVNYDPTFTNWGEVQNVAQAHCDKYGKDAVPDKRSTSDWGVTTQAYNCKKRTK
jgi:hypothetical protein